MAVEKDQLPELSKENNKKFFEDAVANMPVDQQYREYMKNAIEACQKMKAIDPNFKGQIIVEADLNLPNKLSIIDNGIGMKADEIVRLIKDISETEEQSEEGNFGMGAKVAGFANNRLGVLYSSLRYNEDEGSRCQNYLNEDGKYAVKHDDEWDSCRIPLDYDEMNPLIQKYGHGTQVTLLGNEWNDNTMLPPEDYADASMLGKSRKDGIYWLLAYFNTKFYVLPDFITIRVQIKRKDRTELERCYGHQYYLNNYSRMKGSFMSENARYHWWILQDKDGGSNIHKRNSRSECVLNAQVAYLNKGEIIEIEWNQRGKVAPHKLWGLHYSHQHVAIVVEPIGFKQNQYRTSLFKKRKDFNKIKSEIRDYFMENMPEPLRALETELQKKHAEMDAENLVNAKEMAKLLKDFTLEDVNGNELMDDTNLSGGKSLRGNGTGGVNPSDGPLPGESIGSDPLKAGLKNSLGKKKARKAQTPNPMPRVEWADETIQQSWATYDWKEHKVILRHDNPWLKKCAKIAVKKSGNKFSEESAMVYAKNVFNEEVSNRIAFIRFGELGYSEEEKRAALEDIPLAAVLLDPLGIPAKIVDKSKNLMKSHFEMEKAKEEVESKPYEMEQTLPISGIQ